MENRILKIFKVVQDLPPSQDFWDLCCDHGKLGLLALSHSNLWHVHFNDISAPIIKKLEIQLENLNYSNYSLYAQDAKTLNISSERSSLVVIAGVGGQCAQDIVSGLNELHNLENTIFVICSHYHNFELRTKLSQLGFGLLLEDFFFDGKWPYELIVVSKQAKALVAGFSPNLYNLKDANHLKYLKKMQKHYEFKGHKDLLCSIKRLLE